MPKYKLKELMFDKDVLSIEEYEPSEPLINRISILPLLVGQTVYPDLGSLARSAYNHSNSPIPINAGNLVNASTFELGLQQTFLNCIAVNPISWQPIANYNPGNWQHLHSLETFRCLTLAAPAARFFHRESLTYAGVSQGAWLVNNQIQTASLSYDRGGGGPQHQEFREMDDYAYRFPYTVFLNPSGNYGWTLQPGWHPYNSLNVWNVQHHRQSTFFINKCPAAAPAVSPGCTQTRNPEQIYGGICLRPADWNYLHCSSDRELPHIVAPGFTPTSDPNSCVSTPMREACLSGENIWCGSSLSAPITNGVAADIIAADARMASWPEKVRAALLVTAENVEGGEWSQNDDGLDGAGVIHGASAVDFAKTHVTVAPGNAPVGKGIGTGQVTTANWGTNLAYNIAIPNPKPSGKYLRVVLTWDSNPSLTAPINALSDLDLAVVSPMTTRFSTSYNSNVEIVHLTSSQVQAGGTVQAFVNKLTNRIPSEGTTNYFYYCIAWGWVDTHAP